MCEHKLHSVGHTVNCVQNENQKVQLFWGCMVIFYFFPWGLKQTCMLARHRLHKSARCFNKFGSKSLCLFHIDLKIIPPMSYVICCLPWQLFLCFFCFLIHFFFFSRQINSYQKSLYQNVMILVRLLCWFIYILLFFKCCLWKWRRVFLSICSITLITLKYFERQCTCQNFRRFV